jgi:hypothetical protein
VKLPFGPRSETSAGDAFAWTDRPWSASLLLVCQECNGNGDHATPPNVLKEFKSAARAAGPKGRTRVTGSGCLDLCPKHGVAVAVSIDGQPTRCAVVTSSVAGRELAEVLA